LPAPLADCADPYYPRYGYSQDPYYPRYGYSQAYYSPSGYTYSAPNYTYAYSYRQAAPIDRGATTIVTTTAFTPGRKIIPSFGRSVGNA
jgi:hypothetical protein